MNGSASDVSGLRNSRLRKMEYYEKENQLKAEYQIEPSIPSAYENELSLEEKGKILKDIYSSIKLFYRLVYEAKN